MRAALSWTLRGLAAAAGVVAVSLLVWGLASLFRTTKEFYDDTYRTATFIGINPPKALALTAVAIVLLVALPLAIADGVSMARFRRAERELREARPLDVVTPYEGPEGDGLLFEGPEGRLLLLRPPGFGKPRPLALPQAEPPSAPTG